MEFSVRPATADDLPHMADMLWEAAAVADVVREMGQHDGLKLPGVAKYLEDWGRPGDVGVVAIDASGRRLGAAWYRFFTAENPGYGYISDEIPEITIGVDPGARGLGVGRALLEALCSEASARGLKAIGLSVDRENPAAALYERIGFVDAGIVEASKTSKTMIKHL
jgi:ribosomal protein S18 acetylase RimI-like enzyme